MSSTSDRDHRSRIYVVDYHRQPRFYASWVHACGIPMEWLRDFSADWEPPDDAALLVSAETYDEPSVSVLRRGVEKNIPVLILADGILEYRNSWQNPTQVSGNLLRPILGHKLACLGASQCRHVESWGNTGRCEVVGFPAFDELAALRRTARDDEFRLLVASARTPYFDAAQKAVVVAQFADLRRELAAWQQRSERFIQVCWRVPGNLADALGLDRPDEMMAAAPLHEVLPQCHAVITTPSTLMIEAMLLDLPVAVLDYFNVPAYVSPAWRVTAPRQLAETLDELVEPAASKMQFQRVILHDALECATPAVPRMVALARQMIAIGQECRAHGRPLAFPARILPAPGAPPRGMIHESPAPEAAVQLELRHLRRALAGEQGLIALRRAELDAFEARLEGVRLQLQQRASYLDGLRADLEVMQAVALRFVVECVPPARRLLMWGTGSLASALCDRWPSMFEALTGFVNSTPARQGVFRGKPAFSPDVLARGSDFVLVASSFRNEIVAQLDAKGLRPIDDYLILDVAPSLPVG